MKMNLYFKDPSSSHYVGAIAYSAEMYLGYQFVGTTHLAIFDK